MNCQYCHTKHRKFYCTDCIKEKWVALTDNYVDLLKLFLLFWRLDAHEQEFSTCSLEKNAVVAEASEFIQKATLIQNLIAEKNKRLQHIEAMRQTQKSLLTSCTTSKDTHHTHTIVFINQFFCRVCTYTAIEKANQR